MAKKQGKTSLSKAQKALVQKFGDYCAKDTTFTAAMNEAMTQTVTQGTGAVKVSFNGNDYRVPAYRPFGVGPVCSMFDLALEEKPPMTKTEIQQKWHEEIVAHNHSKNRIYGLERELAELKRPNPITKGICRVLKALAMLPILPVLAVGSVVGGLVKLLSRMFDEIILDRR